MSDTYLRTIRKWVSKNTIVAIEVRQQNPSYSNIELTAKTGDRAILDLNLARTLLNFEVTGDSVAQAKNPIPWIIVKNPNDRNLSEEERRFWLDDIGEPGFVHLPEGDEKIGGCVEVPVTDAILDHLWEGVSPWNACETAHEYGCRAVVDTPKGKAARKSAIYDASRER